MRLKPFYSLRKLPCWGQQLEPINFEWPTQDVWDTMDADVTLTSLEFMDEGTMHRVSSVRCVYSEPKYSKTFEKLCYSHRSLVKLNLQSGRKVRRVSAACWQNQMCHVLNLRFFDKESNLVCAYDPHAINQDYKTQQVYLRENEELFGVYGTKDIYNYFSNFGFIVKVKHDSDDISRTKFGLEGDEEENTN